MLKLGKIYEIAARCFGLDFRSLALFRICMGFAILCDLLERSFYLEAHYTKDGILPRGIVTLNFGVPGHLCIHFINDTYTFQSILFTLHAIFAFCMMIGWKTRLFSILCWFWTCSLHSRNPLLLHGGDTILRVILFYNMYLPTGTCFSVDACMNEQERDHDNGKTRPATTYFGLPSIAYFIQLTFCYVTAYSEKSSVHDWQIGDATYYVLQLDYFATSLAALFLHFPATVNFLTRFVLYWELVGPLFLYVPVATQYCRLFGVVGLMLMHIGFASCLRLGVFTIIALSALTAGIPPFVWDFLFSKLHTRERKLLTLYYDVNNPFSRGLRHFLVNFCLIPGTRAYMQEDLSLYRNEKTRPWLILNTANGQTHENMNALIFALEVSPLFSFVPKIISRPLASRIVRNIQAVTLECLPEGPPAPPPPHSRARERFTTYGRRAAMVVLTIGLVALFFHNGNPPWPQAIKFDFEQFKPVLQLLRIDQQWIMFSRPPKRSQWAVFKGTLQDGEVVDVIKNQGLKNWEGGKFDMDEKPQVHDDFINHRWYKYFENGYTKPIPEVKRDFAGWVCRQWNKRHEESKQLMKLEVWYVHESHHLDLSQPRSVSNMHMSEYNCADLPK